MPGQDEGKQDRLIISGIGQMEEWPWQEQTHTRECRRFYEDYGNTAAAAQQSSCLLCEKQRPNECFQRGEM